MGIYAGVKRRHVAPGAMGTDGVPPSKRPQSRLSAFASTDTRDERVRRQMDGWRQFTDNVDRKFVADATLRVPYGNLTQVASAMRGQQGWEGFTETVPEPVMVRSNRYEVLPEWMSRMQVFRSDPVTKQRLADLHHDGDARRLYVEATPSKRITASKRMANPLVEGKRELEPFSARAPYERNLKPDRTPMRDESTLPHTSAESQEIPNTMVVDRTSPAHTTPLRPRNHASHNLLPETMAGSTPRVSSNNTGFMHRVMNSLADTFLPTWLANRTPDVISTNTSAKQRVSANVPFSNIADAEQRAHDASHTEMFHHQHQSMLPNMNAELHPPIRTGQAHSIQHHAQRSIQDEDTAQIHGGHHRAAIRPETKVKPLPEGFAKVADILDVSTWLAIRNGTPITNHQPNLQATWAEQQPISMARSGMEPQTTKFRTTSTRTASAHETVPSVESKNDIIPRPHVRVGYSSHHQPPEVPTTQQRTEPFRASAKVQSTMAAAATSQSQPPRHTTPWHHLPSIHQEVSAVGEIRWETEPIQHAPKTSNRTGRDAFHSAMALGHETVLPTTNGGSLNGTRLQSVPRASSTSIEHPYQPTVLLHDERTAVADEKEETPPRPQWQDRVAPFATHLGRLGANHRDPNIFGGPR